MAEILLALRIPVLKRVVLRTAGTEYRIGTFVSSEPSPTCLPYIVPAERVEKNPYDVEVVTDDVLDTARR